MVKFWKKLKYWQKGGIIGLIVSILPFVFIQFNLEVLKEIVLFLPRNIIVDKLNFNSNYGSGIGGSIADVIIANFLVYPLVGILIGLIIGKIKEKSKDKSPSGDIKPKKPKKSL